MNKYLLGTTALVGASIMASSAMAMPIQSKSEEGVPILTASMVAQFEMGIADNDDNVSSPGTRDGGFVNGRFAEIFFNGELTADNGLVYGAKLHYSTGGVQTNGYPGREWIYLSGGWGTLEFGNWIGADSHLNLCLTCNTYAGYGGLDTPWKSYVITPVSGASGVTSYWVGGAVGGGGSTSQFWFDQSPRVTYLSPVFAGFQVGVDYTPEVARFGTQTGGNPFSDTDGRFKDKVGFGGQWNGDFGAVSVAVSGVGAISDGMLTGGRATTTAPNATRDADGIGYYEIGAVVRYAGFQFGGSWWDEGTSGAIDGRDFGFEQTGWTLEAAYFTGPYGIELQYADTHGESSHRLLDAGTAAAIAAGGNPDGVVDVNDYIEEFDFQAWAVSFGYTVAPGLKWYAEVVGADYDHTANAAAVAAGVPNATDDMDNSAIAILTGLVLSF